MPDPRHSRPVPAALLRAVRTGLILLCLAVLGAGTSGAASSKRQARPAAKPVPELARIRYWTAPDHTRLVFDLTGPAPTQTRFRLADSTTFEVYLPGVRKSPAVTTEFVGDSLVADIFAAVSDGGCSIRIRLKKTTTPLGFMLAAVDGNPDRIVVDVPAPPNPEAERQLAERVTELKRSRNLIVAIDAGHGGEDPGAIGHKRLQEADVTLAIAKKLKAQLDLMPGVSGFLTRTGDYFVPLRKRIDIARRLQADVLVSIHCNASRNRDATGTEIYFLSLTGATDEASRGLAEKENAADLIGGVAPDTGDDLLSILFDLRQNETIRRSSELAEILIDAVDVDSRLTTRGVKQAGFVVLKAPEIPSVLVETAFITNAREAAILKDSHFQTKFAEMLAQGIDRYRSQHARTSAN
ncbi:MAG TPA: N-acetylmuramoyl-L-alanine amidase [Candidatus Eisenbacteria bacterium]|nr:N-acetylmuramoyl-L-alanine amidase [Candidatus Eisenbacteria bacterium]